MAPWEKQVIIILLVDILKVWALVSIPNILILCLLFLFFICRPRDLSVLLIISKNQASGTWILSIVHFVFCFYCYCTYFVFTFLWFTLVFFLPTFYVVILSLLPYKGHTQLINFEPFFFSNVSLRRLYVYSPLGAVFTDSLDFIANHWEILPLYFKHLISVHCVRELGEKMSLTWNV